MPDGMNIGGRGGGWAAALLAALLGCAPWAAAAEQIGTTVFARGAVSAALESDVRLIGHGTPIYERDVLTTGRDSFAVVELNDGTRMTLRPNTVFRLDEYAGAEGEERMRLELFQGGLRTVTGEVAERAPDAFELRTPVATIGVLGTDFSARLCERDCAEEAGQLGDEAGGGPDVIGRVAFVKGEASAVSLFDERRELSAGGPVFQGDTLETGPGAFAVIAFRDESRITLLESTRFRIDRHEYDAEAPEQSSALMRLIRGGIRAVAGLISRARPEAYKVATPVATISTRGTRFDIVCVGGCAREEGAAAAEPPAPAEQALAALLEGLVAAVHAQAELDGLYVVVRFGLVASESPAGAFEFGAGTTAFIGSAQVAPRFDLPLPQVLRAFLERAPAPEEVELPPDLLRDGSRAVEEGDLAVAVYDGNLSATSSADLEEVLVLGEGEAGLLGGGEATRLEGGAPAFVTEDPYNVSPAEVGEDGTLADGQPVAGDDSMSCRM